MTTDNDHYEYDVFISYSHDDKERIQHIVRDLKGSRLTINWDDDWPAGGEWKADHAERAIKAAAFTLVFWSVDSRQSDPTQHEATFARALNRLQMYKIDEVSPPIAFARIQAMQLFADKKTSVGLFTRLIRRVQEDQKRDLDAVRVGKMIEQLQNELVKQNTPYARAQQPHQQSVMAKKRAVETDTQVESKLRLKHVVDRHTIDAQVRRSIGMNQTSCIAVVTDESHVPQTIEHRLRMMLQHRDYAEQGLGPRSFELAISEDSIAVERALSKKLTAIDPKAPSLFVVRMDASTQPKATEVVQSLNTLLSFLKTRLLDVWYAIIVVIKVEDSSDKNSHATSFRTSLQALAGVQVLGELPRISKNDVLAWRNLFESDEYPFARMIEINRTAEDKFKDFELAAEARPMLYSDARTHITGVLDAVTFIQRGAQ